MNGSPGKVFLAFQEFNLQIGQAAARSYESADKDILKVNISQAYRFFQFFTVVVFTHLSAFPVVT